MTAIEGVHQFSIGEFACLVLCDSIVPPPDDASISFVNATDDEVRAAMRLLASHGTPRGMSSNILLVDTGEHRVLIDTGNGVIEGKAGRLLDRLAAVGVRPTDIDIVINTHGHDDHVGGNVDARGQPTFPNARYLITRAEWDYWTTRTPEPRYSGRTHLLAVASQVTFIDPGAEVVPGMETVPLPGHTPGQIAVLIASNGERLLHMADNFHHPVEVLHPGWYFDFDDDPRQTVETRRSVFERAVREQVPVLAYHVAFPGLGRVVSDGDSWRWVHG